MPSTRSCCRKGNQQSSPTSPSTKDEAKQKPKQQETTIKSPPTPTSEKSDTKLPASESPFSNRFEALQDKSPWEEEEGTTPTEEVDTSHKPRTREQDPKDYDESSLSIDKSRHSTDSLQRSQQTKKRGTTSPASSDTAVTKPPSTCAHARPLFQEQFFNLLQHLFNWRDDDLIHEVLESLLEVQVTSWNTFVSKAASMTCKFLVTTALTLFLHFPNVTLSIFHQMVLDRFSQPLDCGGTNAMDINNYIPESITSYMVS